MRYCSYLIKKAVNPSVVGSAAYHMLTKRLGKSRNEAVTRLLNMFIPVEEAEKKHLGYVKSPVNSLLSGVVKSSASAGKELTHQLGEAESRERKALIEADKLRTIEEMSEFSQRSPLRTASHGATAGGVLGGIATAIPSLMLKRWEPLAAGVGLGSLGGAYAGYQTPRWARESLAGAVQKGSKGVSLGEYGSEGVPEYGKLTPRQKELVKRLSRLAERKHG